MVEATAIPYLRHLKLIHGARSVMYHAKVPHALASKTYKRDSLPK
jgi:hypothetical protein